MHIRTLTIMFAIFAVTACSSMNGGIPKTAVGREMRNLNSTSPRLLLRDAVFSLTKDQSREEAIQTLQEDGANCSGSTCSWTFVAREKWIDTIGVRMPGPKRAFEITWRVTMLGESIMSRGDIEADHTSKRIEW